MVVGLILVDDLGKGVIEKNLMYWRFQCPMHHSQPNTHSYDITLITLFNSYLINPNYPPSGKYHILNPNSINLHHHNRIKINLKDL